MIPHTCTVAHTVMHGHEMWTRIEVTSGRLAFGFSGGHAGSRFSRREAEACPQHVCDEVAAFIRSGAIAPMLDYLAERGDLHPRLAAAVEQATEQYLTQSAETRQGV